MCSETYVGSDILPFNSYSAVTFEYESVRFTCPKSDIILITARSGELRGQYTGSSLPSRYSKIDYSVTLKQRYGNMVKKSSRNKMPARTAVCKKT